MRLRNIAIIAHVDHGKTTLVDRLLQQSGAFRDNQRVAERVMDSNDLEKERGITILAKATSVVWKDTRINIVDTPGHADFGGEVERILSMVDGAIVLVDAAEGPMPQTKFVVSQGAEDRPQARSSASTRSTSRTRGRARSSTRSSTSSPRSTRPTSSSISRSSTAPAKQGWMAASPEGPKDQGMAPLFDLVLTHVPQPDGRGRARSACSARSSRPTPILGRIITGRISSGTVSPNQPIKVLDREGKRRRDTAASRRSSPSAASSASRSSEAEAGDIVAIAGLEKVTVADTFCAPEVDEPLQAQPIDPPTVSMTFIVNDSPLAGTEGDKVTSRVIRDRLFKEAEGNVALKVEESADKDSFIVSGRGELQLAILIETMRREGFELARVAAARRAARRDERRASSSSRSRRS